MSAPLMPFYGGTGAVYAGVVRRPSLIVMATVDCGSSTPATKPKPRSKRWRRPKVWRQRDILEKRAVQGKGFRGEVKSATAARQAITERIRAEEHRRRVFNGEWINVLVLCREKQLAMESPRAVPGYTEPVYLRTEPRAWSVPIYRTELETKLQFPGGLAGWVAREFFERLGGYAPEYELKDVLEALGALDWLDFVSSTCKDCGGAGGSVLHPTSFPTTAGTCYGCKLHGKPLTTLPRHQKYWRFPSGKLYDKGTELLKIFAAERYRRKRR